MSAHDNRRRLLATGAVVLSWCGSSSNDVALAFTANTYPSSPYCSVVPSILRQHPQRHCPYSSYNTLTYSTIVPRRGDCNGRSTTSASSASFKLCMASDPIVESKFEKMNEDDDQVIAFMDTSMTRGIDCYVDSYATVDGVEYTIGSPCDYAVAICYFEGEDEQLVPIELDDPLMDDIFPIAEGIIEDEFGEELVLLRTPQTLTLVGVSLCYLYLTCIVLHCSLILLLPSRKLLRNWKRTRRMRKMTTKMMKIVTWMTPKRKLKYSYHLRRMDGSIILYGYSILSYLWVRLGPRILEYY